MTRANFEPGDNRAYRVLVDYLNPHGTVPASTVVGPYASAGPAKGQATAARNEGTRNGGKVRTRLERSLDYWEHVETVTEGGMR